MLRGLQHLYMNEALREQVFTLLENEMAPGVVSGYINTPESGGV